MQVVEPISEEDFRRYYALRWAILRAPWQQPFGSERDDREAEAIHLMVCDEGRVPMGVGRVHFTSSDEAQIRYMAVDEHHRGRGVARLLLQALEARAAAAGARRVVLNARDHAAGFYERHGYRRTAPGHVLFGVIHHVVMTKDLQPSRDCRGPFGASQ